jgi:hypothetical protein
MDNSSLAVIIAGIALLLNLSRGIFGGGWSLSKNLEALKIDLLESLADTRREMIDRHDSESRSYGETVAALREHVRKFELHVRDHYIRKDDFIIHMKSHDDLLRSNFESINKRLDRIEKQLDAKTG